MLSKKSGDFAYKQFRMILAGYLSKIVSRLSRSTKQLCKILEFVENNKEKLIVGGFIVDCTKQDVDPMTMGMLRMMAVFVQMESDITV